jgi:DNA-binding PadR family transcriptional regulator
LEQTEMVVVSKQFVGRKPNTTYMVTPNGREQFRQHLNALEKLLNMQ